MKGNAAAQATQSSRVKPRPVIEKAPKPLQLRLILIDPEALANVRFGVNRYTGDPAATPAMSAIPPKAEVNSEH